MTNSSFNDALDAMVRGQHVADPDKLTRFATDLYEKEQHVMIPTALKSTIGASLGFDAMSVGSTISSVSGKRPQSGSELTRRPWFAAATVVIAISLALTGILRWSLPNGSDPDGNRSGIFSPAVATASATPIATSEASPTADVDWLAAVSPEECPVDQTVSVAELYQPSTESLLNDDWPTREGSPYEMAGHAESEQVVIRQRQMMSCINSQDMRRLPALSSRAQYEQMSPAYAEGKDRDALWLNRIERSKELSAWVEDELGITSADLVHRIEDGPTGPVWEPHNAVQMADGRIALIPSWLTTSSDIQPGYAFLAPVWVLEADQWMLDEEMYFCIGDCDEYWSELEQSFLPPATPANATPDATELDANAWLYPFEPHECPIEQTELMDQQKNPANTWYTMDDYAKVDTLPEYGPIAVADPADANAVMTRLRQHNACGMVPGRALPEFWTVRWEYENRTTAGREYVAADKQRRDEGRQAIAAWYEDVMGSHPGDFVVIQDPVELGLEGTSPNVVHPLYNPAFAIELGDGRIAIPVSQVVYDDPDTTNISREFPAYYPPVAVFAYVEGEWRLDETFQICIGECDDFWASEMATPVASPVAYRP